MVSARAGGNSYDTKANMMCSPFFHFGFRVPLVNELDTQLQ